MRQATLLLLLILGLWLLLSGHYEALLLSFGVASSLAVVLISVRMDLVEEQFFTPRFLVRLLAYLPWLIKEVFVANVVVARMVLSPRLSISPTLVRFRTQHATDLGRFVYANSITLTPGTITTEASAHDLQIHALMLSAVDGREETEMARKVARLEA